MNTDKRISQYLWKEADSKYIHLQAWMCPGMYLYGRQYEAKRAKMKLQIDTDCQAKASRSAACGPIK